MSVYMQYVTCMYCKYTVCTCIYFEMAQWRTSVCVRYGIVFIVWSCERHIGVNISAALLTA